MWQPHATAPAAMLNLRGDNAQRKRKSYRLSLPGTLALNRRTPCSKRAEYSLGWHKAFMSLEVSLTVLRLHSNTNSRSLSRYTAELVIPWRSSLSRYAKYPLKVVVCCFFQRDHRGYIEVVGLEPTELYLGDSGASRQLG